MIHAKYNRTVTVKPTAGTPKTWYPNYSRINDERLYARILHVEKLVVEALEEAAKDATVPETVPYDSDVFPVSMLRIAQRRFADNVASVLLQEAFATGVKRLGKRWLHYLFELGGWKRCCEKTKYTAVSGKTLFSHTTSVYRRSKTK